MKKQLLLALGLALSSTLSAFIEINETTLQHLMVQSFDAQEVMQLLKKAEDKVSICCQSWLPYEKRIKAAKKAAKYLKAIDALEPIPHSVFMFIEARVNHIKENIKELFTRMQSDLISHKADEQVGILMMVASFVGAFGFLACADASVRSYPQPLWPAVGAVSSFIGIGVGALIGNSSADAARRVQQYIKKFKEKLGCEYTC